MHICVNWPQWVNERNETTVVSIMMTSWHGLAFYITGPLWGEPTAHWWIPLTKASNVELWCFVRYWPEEAVEHTIELLVIWDAVMSNHHWLKFWTNFLRHPKIIQAFIERSFSQCFGFKYFPVWFHNSISSLHVPYNWIVDIPIFVWQQQKLAPVWNSSVCWWGCHEKNQFNFQMKHLRLMALCNTLVLQCIITWDT